MLAGDYIGDADNQQKLCDAVNEAVKLKRHVDSGSGACYCSETRIIMAEAHTIVPEAYSAGFDYDTQWVVNRIGQIALQGRKYGVGLLVISQRTALVSKTILSQCNTFFTHSLIDQTSLNFLDSVYSSQHTKLIPNLLPLHFLAFGKALRADRPIMLARDYDPAKKEASERLQYKSLISLARPWAR